MIKPNNPNSEFELGGINHVALVCSDMERTVDFYSNVLGMPLIKSLDLPGGMGQHFFFDAGNGDCVAFFWFADAPDRVPGVSSPEAIPGIGDIVSAVSTMNHLAFHVPAEKFDEYRQRLKDKGVRVGPGAQPRRERGAGVADGAPWRVRAVVLLPRSRRHHARVRLLDQGIHRERHHDGAEDRGGPPASGALLGASPCGTAGRLARRSSRPADRRGRRCRATMSPASHAVIVCVTPPTTKCAAALVRSLSGPPTRRRAETSASP